MRAAVLLLVVVAVLMGCSKPDDAAAPPPTTAQASGTSTPPGGGGGSVAPMTTPVGGITPVTGSESLQGGGGSVGQSAKDMARKTAGKVSGSSSLDQMGGGSDSGGQ